ncbi:D-amino-acid transaminase [Sporolactobacillus shoreicorticis]|uniref:D-alanine aminotransferase n=1 Tax=Sporolactobacillus shoreicorticis TaxID=1923877 RepID=A0ABW5S7J4_9BACL|nr:D-amino-acid transaminase [Sporolactobacillus shoreicorticis]MCO7126931.1 D-amino-acid transaminase [Sporolactobacillus shoreicorticis]
MSTILYNDSFLRREQGKVDMEDRGYQFGDGIYEALRVYNGKMFLLDLHMKRLNRSARELRLSLPYDTNHLAENLDRLIRENQIDYGYVYFQITRGAIARKHRFPEQKIDCVLTGSVEAASKDEDLHADGIKVSLLDDIRWLRCDIKTLNLLGNVLANQEAFEQGSDDAILHRDGVVTEGTTCNAFIVKDGVLITHPADHFILNGITRIFVLELAERLGIPVEERTYTTEELRNADEAFITSTGVRVTPVIRIDDQSVGDGKPGLITLRLLRAFNLDVEQFIAEA